MSRRSILERMPEMRGVVRARGSDRQVIRLIKSPPLWSNGEGFGSVFVCAYDALLRFYSSRDVGKRAHPRRKYPQRRKTSAPRNEAVPVILSKEPKLRPHLWSLWLDRVEVFCNWDYSGQTRLFFICFLSPFPFSCVSSPGSLNSFLRRRLRIGEFAGRQIKRNQRDLRSTCTADEHVVLETLRKD